MDISRKYFVLHSSHEDVIWRDDFGLPPIFRLVVTFSDFDNWGRNGQKTSHYAAKRKASVLNKPGKDAPRRKAGVTKRNVWLLETASEYFAE